MSQFTSSFWDFYIGVISIVSILACGVLLLVQSRRRVGVPYADQDIAGARAELKDKTELDALIAYLQVLGTALKQKAN